MENGASFTASIFIDASYEGDLMAQSGVSYTWGREARVAVQRIARRRARGNSAPSVSGGHLPLRRESQAAAGDLVRKARAGRKSADRAVQAYNFRLCFSESRANQVPFPKPSGYDAARYQLLARLIDARIKAEGRVPELSTLLKIDRVPNSKADVNNQGPFSTDYIGASWDYPEASLPAPRRDLAGAQATTSRAALFPRQRSAGPRRTSRGDATMGPLQRRVHRQRQLAVSALHPRSAPHGRANTSWCKRICKPTAPSPTPSAWAPTTAIRTTCSESSTPKGFVRNEGDMQVPVKPYQIPYRVMLPKRQQATNLLVPVAFSASHVAYSSLRMEPQYMIIGQAAGVAAKLSISSKKPVQEIDVTELANTLRKQGAVLAHD